MPTGISGYFSTVVQRRLTYALDGSESRNTINMGRGPQEILSKAVRQDGTLVITSRYRFDAPDGARTETIEVKQVFSLDASGSLVITTTRSGPGGAPPSISATMLTPPTPPGPAWRTS